MSDLSEYLRSMSEVDGDTFDQAADEIERLTARNEKLEAVYEAVRLHPNAFPSECDDIKNAIAAVQTTEHGVHHITTGDVRLDLGWTQEECDAEDNK